MKIEYDARKRRTTLEQRGLDFNDAVQVFASFHLTRSDDRQDYGEERSITVGALDERPVVIVWTSRGEVVRVISMRIADNDERNHYWRELERSG